MSGQNAVSLSLPVGAFTEVARLVTAGFLSQFAFGYEAIGDVQLAVELVLRLVPVSGSRAELSLAADGERVTITLGTFEGATLERHMREVVRDDLCLATVLRRLVGNVEVAAGSPAKITMHTRIETAVE